MFGYNLKIRMFWVFSVLCIGFSSYCLSQFHNEILIGRYVSSDEFVFLTVISEVIYFIFLYYILKNTNLRWEQYIFYGVMLTAIFFVIFFGYVTHGESIRSLLFRDKNDALMDFYNSVQYGMKPYENYVIYPPLINVIYGFLGRFMIHEGSAFLLRVNQMGVLIYGLYSVVVYAVLFYLIYKVKSGSRLEKVLFTFSIFFSVPFLFLYDRGNSIAIMLPFFIVFYLFHSSDSFNKRLLSYFSLGIMAGIKISPAFLGILFIRKKKWKAAIMSLIIGIIIFFVPFLFTDGNIFILLDNIKRTPNLNNALYFNQGLYFVGNGPFVNLSSFFVILGRIFDYNVNLCIALSKYILITIGLGIILFSKRLASWKIWTIILSILVLLPGFTVVYWLMMFVIPLIMFLNSEPKFTLKNILVLFCFIGMFIPIINYPVHFLDIFIEDFYPAKLSTLLECTSVITITIILYYEGAKDIVYQHYNKKKFFSISVVWFLAVFFLCHIVTQNRAIESFYTANIDAVYSISGVKKVNGQFLGIEGNEATIHLSTEKVLDKGLLISFGRWDGLQSAVNEDIVIFVNNDYVAGEYITGLNNQYVFISADNLKKYIGLSDIKVTFVRQNINAEYVPILYVGPAELFGNITDASMISYSTMGLQHNQGYLKADKKFSFLCDVETLNNGIVIDYNVPISYFNRSVVMKINGVQIQRDHVYKEGQNFIYASKEMLPLKLQKSCNDNGIFNVEVEFCDDTDNSISNMLTDGDVAVSYIGVLPELNAWRNISLGDGHNRVILPVNQVEKGLDIAFSLSNLSTYKDVGIQIFQDERFLGTYFLNNGNDFQGIHIPSELLDLNGTVIDLSFKVVGEKNVNSNLISIHSIATNTIQTALLGYKDDLDVMYFNKGLTFDKQNSLWYMGEKATFCILPSLESNVLKLRYDVSEYLLMNSDVCIDVYVNGEKMYSGLPHEVGENEVDIALPEYVMAKNNGCVQIMLLANRTYNLKKLHISRLKEIGGDRSIGIKYVGF